ncbi:MAG: hypothetical protein Q4C96_04505 [Planctomycetia bacterium]|nr:hypothetical protein [Planctomycetia bacterium]
MKGAQSVKENREFRRAGRIGILCSTRKKRGVTVSEKESAFFGGRTWCFFGKDAAF